MSSRHPNQARLGPGRAAARPPDRSRRRRLIAVICAIIAAVALAGTAGRPVTASPRDDGGFPPWPAPADPRPGIKAAGLKAEPMEGAAEHYHAHLDIYVNGKPVPVAADVGIDPASQTLTDLHTHDTTGVLHIESHTKGTRYTLGQFFTEWGVKLTRDQIGALRTGGGRAFAAYVGGRPFPGDPAAIVLAPHQEIALVYGPPNPSFEPPSGYTFPPDE